MLVINTSRSSPNHSSRNGLSINLVVLHASAGTLASSLNWLCSSASQVSSHYVIAQNGDIYSIVPDSLAAWHAGKSRFGQMFSEEIRDRSIGIELENRTGMKGFKGQDPYPKIQIDALSRLVTTLIARYTIPQTNIVRHLDIAVPAGRKTDPAGFPWDAWLLSLAPIPTAPPLASHPYRVGFSQAVFEAPRGDGAIALNRTAVLAAGQQVDIDEVRSDGWGHLSNGLGFVPVSILERL